MYNKLRTAVKTTNFWTSQALVTNMVTCFGLMLTIFRPLQHSYIAETKQPYTKNFLLIYEFLLFSH